jgi:aryl-alcohol dehydrogenase-like predicted oxidoreductase
MSIGTVVSGLRDQIVGDLDASLACLGVEQIDLYYLHRDDPS